MGKQLQRRRSTSTTGAMRVFQPGADRAGSDDRDHSTGSTTRRSPCASESLRPAPAHDIALVTGAAVRSTARPSLRATQTPVFFGSAIHNFGVREVLDALVEFAPPPRPRKALERLVASDEPKFSGVVFKIQANMDPAHRDRIAFMRVCSGHFERGMRLKIARTGKASGPTSVVSFLSQRRDLVDDAYAGDIIGIPNHGVLQLGDTLTEGEELQLHRAPVLRAGAIPDGRDCRPAAQQAAADRASRSSARKARSRCSGRWPAARCCWAPSARSSSTWSRTGCATSTASEPRLVPAATRLPAGSPRRPARMKRFIDANAHRIALRRRRSTHLSRRANTHERRSPSATGPRSTSTRCASTRDWCSRKAWRHEPQAPGARNQSQAWST